MTKLFAKEGEEYKEVDAFLQPEVDDIVKTRLDRERTKYADYDTLKEQAGKVETVKSEYETKLADATKAAEELKKQLSTTALEVDKVKIVNEYKLPEELHEFVTGSDADEMRKRAEKLSKGVKPSKMDLDKNPKPDEKKSSSKAIAGKLFGSKSDD